MLWKQISKELNLKTFLFDLYKVGFKSEFSGKEGLFDVLESKDWANIIAITKDDKVIMVEQFRFGTSEVSLEFPSGAIDQGEKPMEAASRELLEETGGEGDELIKTGECKANPGFLNNTCHHFLAKNVTISKKQNLDELEEIRIKLVPVHELESLILNGTINHSLSITAWYYYKAKVLSP
jgi:ADP-ribose pyrophosphatase